MKARSRCAVATSIVSSWSSTKSVTVTAPSSGDGDAGDAASKGICFIATACYGTPMAEEVRILSEFRDKYLLANPLGQVLIQMYYKFSPPIADYIKDNESLKKVVREILEPVVKIVSLIK